MPGQAGLQVLAGFLIVDFQILAGLWAAVQVGVEVFQKRRRGVAAGVDVKNALAVADNLLGGFALLLGQLLHPLFGSGLLYLLRGREGVLGHGRELGTEHIPLLHAEGLADLLAALRLVVVIVAHFLPPGGGLLRFLHHGHAMSYLAEALQGRFELTQLVRLGVVAHREAAAELTGRVALQLQNAHCHAGFLELVEVGPHFQQRGHFIALLLPGNAQFPDRLRTGRGIRGRRRSHGRLLAAWPLPYQLLPLRRGGSFCYFRPGLVT